MKNLTMEEPMKQNLKIRNIISITGLNFLYGFINQITKQYDK